MFGLRGKSSTQPSAREALSEAMLGEFIRGFVRLGFASVRYQVTDERYRVCFLALGDPILRSVTVGIDRSGGRSSGPVLVSISGEARLSISDPAELSKLHRTALDHIASAPAEQGVKLKAHWNSVIALVDLDLDPADYTFKGVVAVTLLDQMLEGILGDIKTSIQPYLR